MYCHLAATKQLFHMRHTLICSFSYTSKFHNQFSVQVGTWEILSCKHFIAEIIIWWNFRCSRQECPHNRDIQRWPSNLNQFWMWCCSHFALEPDWTYSRKGNWTPGSYGATLTAHTWHTSRMKLSNWGLSSMKMLFASISCSHMHPLIIFWTTVPIVGRMFFPPARAPYHQSTKVSSSSIASCPIFILRCHLRVENAIDAYIPLLWWKRSIHLHSHFPTAEGVRLTIHIPSFLQRSNYLRWQ